MILLHQSTDYSTHIKKTDSNGFCATVRSRETAILHICNHFLRHTAPPALCFNCFCSHLPSQCPDPPRDYQSLIDACSSLPHSDIRSNIYSTCPTCGLPHPPRRGQCLYGSQA